MKKKIILITAGMLFFNTVPYTANAEHTYYSGDYTINYDISGDDTIEIKKCSGDGESLYLPDTIDGLPITEIDPLAFIACQNLTEINVSYSNEYFSCENGMLIKNSENVLIKYVGTDNTAEIPYGVEKIQGNAFFNAKSEYIEIPETVSYIDDYAFMGCISLKSIEIPDRTEYLGKGCFFSCTYLESVKLPNNITAILNDTFFACPNLKELIIPESVTSIGNDILSPSEDTGYNPLIYGFYGSPAENYAYENNISYRMIGDVNNDSHLNSSDASEVLSEYALVSSGADSSFDNYQTVCADINGDGVIDSSDASTILAKYAEISSGI